MSRVAREEFVGRSDELRRVVALSSMDAKARGLLLLAAPLSGASELLRQAYDEIFAAQHETIPIYFAFTPQDKTSASAAQHFLHTFLLQLTAHRRQDPALINSSLTLADFTDLAAPADFEWIERLIERFERERQSGDERALVRLCLSAPQRAAAEGVRTLVMLDCLEVAAQLDGTVALDEEAAQIFLRGDNTFVLSGFRRRLLDLAHNVRASLQDVETLRLERLKNGEARELTDRLALSLGVQLNSETRDLIIQQLGGSPFFINALLTSAREKSAALTGFLNCQRLYVDEMLGGRINRYFASILEEAAPQEAVQRALVRVLYETLAADNGRASIEAWRKRLNLEGEEFRAVLQALHTRELVSWNINFIEAVETSPVWVDYLRARYRMEVSSESRALVVAETLLETLKRAPQTMARHYRRETALGLRELISRFDCQRVPASLFHFDRFSRAYKSVEPAEISSRLDAETDLIRLPQVVHASSCLSFYPPAQNLCDEERCAIAHGFDAGNYTDESEVVWVVAEIESKVEAGRGLTEMWLDRLSALARSCGFTRVRLWLVAREGFSAEAAELLTEREAYGSSRQQLELLTERLEIELPEHAEASTQDEFELAIPMGDDTELIAASTVEQIARRTGFRPEAINQIKTAVVEACINATEHSLSPDRKIYQRFRVESDKLVVTISSRGLLLPNGNGQNGEKAAAQDEEGNGRASQKGRRGWGLKLIRSLMDEVEFERVDDGTRLRMAKYRK